MASSDTSTLSAGMLVWGRISPGGEARQLVDVAVVVGEGRLDQDPLARVVRREGVDHGRGAGDVGVPADVKPDPLVAVARTGQPVFVVDAGGGRGERVPHLVLAGDDRAARGLPVGLVLDGPRGRERIALDGLDLAAVVE